MIEIIDLIDALFIRHNTYDPFIIAHRLEIKVEFVDFDESPRGDNTIIAGKPFILINSDAINTGERYFICAHELFHAIEKHTNLKNYDSNKIQKISVEREANIFATKLALKLYEETLQDVAKKPSDLKETYGVPEKFSYDFF